LFHKNNPTIQNMSDWLCLSAYAKIIVISEKAIFSLG